MLQSEHGIDCANNTVSGGMATNTRHAQELLEHLAPDQVAAIVHLMEVMLDPVSRSLANAPLEDERPSGEEELTAAESRKWLMHNQPISTEKLLSALGLTSADFGDKN